MSKAKFSDGDVELPEQTDNRFSATSQALPWGENLRASDRHAARQFIANLHAVKFAEFTVDRIYRDDEYDTVRVTLIPDDSCLLSYGDGQRATDMVGYECTEFIHLQTGKLSYHLKRE